ANGAWEATRRRRWRGGWWRHSSPGRRLRGTGNLRGMATTTSAPRELPWTNDEQANRLLASDPNALLIGFVLDQQVPVQKAFAGPLALSQRLGHLDPARIAKLDPNKLSDVFREKP